MPSIKEICDQYCEDPAADGRTPSRNKTMWTLIALGLFLCAWGSVECITIEQGELVLNCISDKMMCEFEAAAEMLVPSPCPSEYDTCIVETNIPPADQPPVAPIQTMITQIVSMVVPPPTTTAPSTTKAATTPAATTAAAATAAAVQPTVPANAAPVGGVAGSLTGATTAIPAAAPTPANAIGNKAVNPVVR